MRKPRVIIENGIYHVFGRVNRNLNELETIQVRDLLLQVIDNAHEKYDFILYGIVVMPNHYHLIIKPINGSSLSRMMQWILSVFVMRYNRFMGISGRFWADRFKSKPITTAIYFIRALFYLALNPVKANLVGKREDWIHSSYTIIMQNNRKWFTIFGKIPQTIEFVRNIFNRFERYFANMT